MMEVEEEQLADVEASSEDLGFRKDDCLSSDWESHSSGLEVQLKA